MLAIILAAGRGSRMGNLTQDTPKPMLRVLGKTLIEWKLEALPGEVTEIILVVGYRQQVIRAHFGSMWRGKRITYVVQQPYQLFGTGYALHLCLSRGIIAAHDKTLVLMGDDIYDPLDLAALCRVMPSMLVARPEPPDPSRDWQVFVNEQGHIDHIAERPEQGRVSQYVNAGAYCIDARYFDAGLKRGAGQEYTIPHAVLSLVHTHNMPFTAVCATRWIQITDPESIATAEEQLASA